MQTPNARRAAWSGGSAQVIGPDAPYELVWQTLYRFSQRLADRFRVGRVFLAGDAAHVMSPFGARGLNSGAADAENLAWKLAAVLRGDAGDALLDSYEGERRPAAIENLAVTDATMRFMVPHGPWRRLWRNLVLRLSEHLPSVRRRVNSGRLAAPFAYPASPILGRGVVGLPAPGTVLLDVPVEAAGASRLRELTGSGFVALVFDATAAAGAAPVVEGVKLLRVGVEVGDPSGRLAATYDPDGAARAWLIRPDGYLAGVGPAAELPAMLARARGDAARTTAAG